MILGVAGAVLLAQVATAPPQNPCSDQLAALCQISAYFCPSAYPENLVPGTNGIPCWPDDRQPVAATAGAQRERQTVALDRGQPRPPASAPQAISASNASSGSRQVSVATSGTGPSAAPPSPVSFWRRLLERLTP